MSSNIVAAEEIEPLSSSQEEEEEVVEEKVVTPTKKKRPLTAEAEAGPVLTPDAPKKKPRAKKASGYIPKQVTRDPPDARKIPRNEEEKGSKRIARTKTAKITIDGGDLSVEVKKGRHTKTYGYTYINKDKIGSTIKSSMEKDKFTWLSYERLAAAYPDLYWLCIYHFKTMAGIEDLLNDEGVPSGQRRVQRK